MLNNILSKFKGITDRGQAPAALLPTTLPREAQQQSNQASINFRPTPPSDNLANLSLTVDMNNQIPLGHVGATAQEYEVCAAWARTVEVVQESINPDAMKRVRGAMFASRLNVKNASYMDLLVEQLLENNREKQFLEQQVKEQKQQNPTTAQSARRDRHIRRQFKVVKDNLQYIYYEQKKHLNALMQGKRQGLAGDTVANMSDTPQLPEVRTGVGEGSLGDRVKLSHTVADLSDIHEPPTIRTGIGVEGDGRSNFDILKMGKRHKSLRKARHALFGNADLSSITLTDEERIVMDMDSSDSSKASASSSEQTQTSEGSLTKASQDSLAVKSTNEQVTSVLTNEGRKSFQTANKRVKKADIIIFPPGTILRLKSARKKGSTLKNVLEIQKGQVRKTTRRSKNKTTNPAQGIESQILKNDAEQGVVAHGQPHGDYAKHLEAHGQAYDDYDKAVVAQGQVCTDHEGDTRMMPIKQECRQDAESKPFNKNRHGGGTCIVAVIDSPMTLIPHEDVGVLLIVPTLIIIRVGDFMWSYYRALRQKYPKKRKHTFIKKHL